MKKSKTKRIRRLGVKWRIIAITTLPMLFACFVITFFAAWILADGLQVQILKGLKSSATGALISLDSVSGESFRLVGDDLYKGDYNVSQNMELLDFYAESNNLEIAFFTVTPTGRQRSGMRTA